ncbi:MAG: cation transporter [Anaerolineae bacterium]|nr:cation transporter [Anaerolineae bacterium]
MSVGTAAQEKNRAALSSVWAAVFLTGFKIIVGIASGSLGILAEAAHSGLDLVAALVTFFAVRISDRPPDQEHPFGHGKVENLSALVETLLLLITCVWIIYEAIHRLTSTEIHVDASIWAFLVMFVSIVVDYNRSRMLKRAADKHKSQALEADALHFSTDIWSSSVVIVGLAGVKLGELAPSLAFLEKADAAAALAVAGIVIVVSLRLGKRAVDALIDTAPPGLSAKIEQAVEAIPGVLECHRVRIRPSGPRSFVDIHVVMDDRMPLDEAHKLTETVEQTIKQLTPGADVMVHPEPRAESEKPLDEAE